MTQFQEQQKERLIEQFKDDLSDIDKALGNALWKNARDHNPLIKIDSPVEEKINSLPEDQQEELYTYLSELSNAFLFSDQLNSMFNSMGV